MGVEDRRPDSANRLMHPGTGDLSFQLANAILARMGKNNFNAVADSQLSAHLPPAGTPLGDLIRAMQMAKALRAKRG